VRTGHGSKASPPRGLYRLVPSINQRSGRMTMTMLKKCGAAGVLLTVGFGAGFLSGQRATVSAQANRVFELRIATTSSKEKLDILMNRFRRGEVKIWDRLGMKPVAFWVPTDAPKSENTLVYILAHESRQKADESWGKFRDDPEWKAFPKTPDLGPVQVDRTFMAPVDFSPMK
jgi:hypothetical protein